MPLPDWMDNYPHVKALMQQEEDILEYESKGDKESVPPLADLSIPPNDIIYINGHPISQVDTSPGEIVAGDVTHVVSDASFVFETVDAGDATRP